MPVGGIGYVTEWWNSCFVVIVCRQRVAVFNDFVGPFPVIQCELAVCVIKEVQSAGYTGFFIIYRPFCAVGIEQVVAGEKLKEAEGIVGVGFLSKIVFFNFAVQKCAEGTCFFSLRVPLFS